VYNARMNAKIYYVYLHSKPDGTVFYIGKGCGKRAYSSAQRTAKWNEIAKKGYVVNIVASSLEEVEAYKLETDLISYLYRFGNLVNVRAGGGPLGQHYLYKGRKLSNQHRERLTIANRSYLRERYDKSSLTLSSGEWITPLGSYHSLRLAAEANGCSIMTVKNRCIGFTAKRGSKTYPVPPKEGWSYKKNDVKV